MMSACNCVLATNYLLISKLFPSLVHCHLYLIIDIVIGSGNLTAASFKPRGLMHVWCSRPSRLVYAMLTPKAPIISCHQLVVLI